MVVLQRKPLLSLTELGTRAQFQLHTEAEPLFIFDIQCFVLQAVMHPVEPYKPRWCRIGRPGSVSHTVVILVDGVSADDFRKYSTATQPIQEMFDMVNNS